MTIIVIIIIIVIISSPISINIKILKDKKNDELIVKLKLLYGLIKLKFEYPLFEVDLEENKINLKIQNDTNLDRGIINEENNKFSVTRLAEKIKEGKVILKKYKRLSTYIVDHTNWEYFSWVSQIGMENAACTGLLTGILDILKTNFIIYLKNIGVNFEDIKIKTIPNFDIISLNTRLNCIFNIKIGYIIIAGIKLLKIRFIR